MNIFYHTLGSPDSFLANTWHYSVRCQHCDHPMAQAAEPPADRARPAFSRSLVTLRCALCDHEASYDAGWASHLT
jgi:hypothetical protein